MGLPRYLQDKENEWIEHINQKKAMPMDLYFRLQDYFMVANPSYGHNENFSMFNIGNLQNDSKPTTKVVGRKKWDINDFIRHGIRWNSYLLDPKYYQESDYRFVNFYIFKCFSEIHEDIFLGSGKEEYACDKRDSVLYAAKYIKGQILYGVYEPRKIKKTFLEKVAQISAKKYTAHLEEYKSNPSLYKYKYWKKTDSRTYKGTLRHLIFERDNYTCQCCGITIKNAMKKGIHLEVDHIIEWEDGGETTYQNGQTLCSECNKAKHRTKRLKIAV